MLKYILSILVTALVAFVTGLYMPWWGIAIAAFLVSAAIPQKPAFSFLSGFLGVFLLWEVLAWWIDNKNNGILSQKIASTSTGRIFRFTDCNYIYYRWTGRGICSAGRFLYAKTDLSADSSGETSLEAVKASSNFYLPGK